MFHIVYLRSGGMLLTRKVYADWRKIQDAFEEYQASLGPWPAETVLEFLRTEYPGWFGTAEEERVNEFFRTDREEMEV